MTLHAKRVITYSLKLCLIKYKLYINVFSLRIYAAGNHIGIVKMAQLQTKKNDNIFHIIDKTKVLRVPFKSGIFIFAILKILQKMFLPVNVASLWKKNLKTCLKLNFSNPYIIAFMLPGR